jgi:deoxyuridine 5'-triphosphate nucleotidohydrolase
MRMSSLSKQGYGYVAETNFYIEMVYVCLILIAVLTAFYLFIILGNRRVKVKLLNGKAFFRKGFATSAGVDVSAAEVVKVGAGMYCIQTGLAVEIPAGHFGLLCFRSGAARRLLEECGVMSAPGVIDADYRGELLYYFRTLQDLEVFEVKQLLGTYPLQIVFIKINDLNPAIAEELNPTKRGVGGFGSSN